MHIFFDFDSTLVAKESLDEVISLALLAHPERERLVSEVEAITTLGMEGKIPFTESVKRRLTVASLVRAHLEHVGKDLTAHITPHISRVLSWLRDQNHETHVMSGGVTECITPVAQILAFPESQIHTNRFLFTDEGVVCGVDESAPLWTNEGKAPALFALREHYPRETFVMVGDGMNDYRAYERGGADHFIGYGEHIVRSAVKEKAPHFAHSAEELLNILQKIV